MATINRKFSLTKPARKLYKILRSIFIDFHIFIFNNFKKYYHRIELTFFDILQVSPILQSYYCATNFALPWPYAWDLDSVDAQKYDEALIYHQINELLIEEYSNISY